MLNASREFREARRAPRHTLNRFAKIMGGTGSLPRDCLIVDISDNGVRLHAEHGEVPDQFTILISGVEPGRRECRVIWRLGFEIGAAFNDVRSGFAWNVVASADH
jgi:hypothetical protein